MSDHSAEQAATLRAALDGPKALGDLLVATAGAIARPGSDTELGKLSQAMQKVAWAYPMVSSRDATHSLDPALVEAGLFFLEFAGTAVSEIAKYLRTGERPDEGSRQAGTITGTLAGVFATLDVLTENGYTTEDTIRKRALGVFGWMRQHVKHALVPADPVEDEPEQTGTDR